MNDVRTTRQWLIQQIRASLDELERLDGDRVAEPQRPAAPTLAWSMLAPTTVRWNGEVELSARAWEVLHAIMTLGSTGQAVPFESIIELIGHVGEDLSIESIRCHVKRTNRVLRKISWPWVYNFSGRFITRN